MKNYYDILGVTKQTSGDEIKKAYRKLAMKYHPDRDSSPTSAEKFKEINEAYETLGDEVKRQQYDQQREFGGHMGGMGGMGQGPFAGGFNFHAHGAPPGFESIFEQIFGGSPFAQRAARNSDTHIQLTISLEEAFVGKTLPIQFTDSGGKPVNVNVTIQPGVESGTRLRFAGNGSRTHGNLPPGDLYVTIVVGGHARFERSGAHLITSVDVPLWRCLAGCEVPIVTIDGGTVNMKIPPLTRDQSVLRIKEKGMPTNAGARTRGDLLVKIITQMPSSLTPQQVQQLTEWATA
jgi:DnaJ-class molecular chaperone